MEEECQQFIAEAFQIIISGGQQSTDDPYLRAMFQYSGSQFNDQGDLAACLRSPDMNFVEAKFSMNGLSLYRGLCMKNACNAQFFTDHVEEIATFLSQFMQLPFSSDSLFFIQYPVAKSSVDNYGFITISIILGLILFLILASLFTRIYSRLKQKFNMKKKINLDKSSNNNDEESLQEQLVSRNILSHESNHTQKEILNSQKTNQNLKDIEGTSINKKQINDVKSHSLLYRIIDCWNVKNNIIKTFTATTRNTDLLAFDCIRVISFVQVVLGHEFITKLSYYSNFQDFDIIQKNPFMLFLLGCFYSVDVFFLLGGFFVAYVIADPKMLQHFQIKNPVKMISSFFMAIINRVARILPSYFIQLYILWQYVNQLGDSPTWFEFEAFSSFCNDNKWKKFLFFDNLLNEDNYCFGWTWYLSIDIQMFVGSLFLMIIYANNQKLGKIVILLALAAFTGTAIYSAFHYKLLVVSQMVVLYNPNQTLFYTKPWSRSPPYIIGLIFGILYKEYTIDRQNKQKESFLSKISLYLSNTLWKWFSYAFGITIIILLTFIPRSLQLNGTDYWNQDLQHFIFGISRFSYAFGVVCVLLPAVCGSKDLIVKVMNAKIFQFISKLTFQGYLFHFTFLIYSVWSFNDSVYLNIENFLFIFIADFFFVLMFSLLFFILIEMPFNNLANIIFNKSPHQRVEKQVKEEKLENAVKNLNQNIN